MPQTQFGRHKIIVSFGLYRSASTWMFNVIRSLVSKSYSVNSIYAEKINDLGNILYNHSDFLLIKTHNPDHLLQTFIKYNNAKVIITVREPLDCVASLMRQFHLSFDDALDKVSESCSSILMLKSIVDHAVFIYEKAENRNSNVVREVAEFLRLSASDEICEAISQEFSSKNVKNFIDKLTEEEYFNDAPPAVQHHAETHWHPRHIGDGTIGSYGEILTEKQIRITKKVCKQFRDDFKYSLQDKIPEIQSGTIISFSDNGISYCSHGFSRPEDWGIWTDSQEALLIIPLARTSSEIRLQMWCVLSPAMRSNNGSILSIMLNEYCIFNIKGSSDNNSYFHLAAFANVKSTNVININIKFANLINNDEVIESSDTRKLGIGIIRLNIEYN